MAKFPSLYQNPKDWVEGEGRSKKREALTKIMESQMQAWLDGHSTRLKAFWQDPFSEKSRQLREQTGLEVSAHYQGLTEALGKGYDLNTLEKIRNELNTLTSNSDER